MKKLFTFAMALMAAMAINATDYYFVGAANGWSNNNDAWKFTDVNGVLTLEVADLYGEFKVTENGGWHPQHGAAAAGEGVALNGSSLSVTTARVKQTLRLMPAFFSPKRATGVTKMPS